jgi:hypothetical protein
MVTAVAEIGLRHLPKEVDPALLQVHHTAQGSEDSAQLKAENAHAHITRSPNCRMNCRMNISSERFHDARRPLSLKEASLPQSKAGPELDFGVERDDA